MDEPITKPNMSVLDKHIREYRTVDEDRIQREILTREMFGTEMEKSPIQRLEDICDLFYTQERSEKRHLYGLFYEIGTNILVHSYGLDRPDFELDPEQTVTIHFYLAVCTRQYYEGVVIDFGEPAIPEEIERNHEDADFSLEDELKQGRAGKGLDYIDYFTDDFMLPTFDGTIPGNVCHFTLSQSDLVD